jgi:hypothetical protein
VQAFIKDELALDPALPAPTTTVYEFPGGTEILFLYDKAPPEIHAVATVTTETEVTPVGATHVYEVPLPV